MLVLAVATVGCRRDDASSAKAATDPVAAEVPEPVEAPDVEPPDLEPAEDDDPELIEQLPVPPTPLVFTTGIGGGVDLDVTGLPAIRADGARIARVERGLGVGEQRRLALRILAVPSGDVVREHVILDPARDISRGKLPSQSVMDRRLAAANAALDASAWLSMIEPESVLPDGWIRCRAGSQDFEVAGLLVSYAEPNLTIKRGAVTLYAQALTGWLAKDPAPGCEPRGFIADAALDIRGGLESGRLLLDLQYCGDCAVAPRVAVVTWGTAAPN